MGELERKIAIEIGEVHRAAKEGKDETINSTDNILALIASYSREARLDELERINNFRAATNVSKEKAQYIQERIKTLQEASSEPEGKPNE